MPKKEKETEREKEGKKREGQEAKIVEKTEKKIEREGKKERIPRERENAILGWAPKTRLGKDVKEGRIKEINEIFNKNLKILEYQIVDILLPYLESELIHIGQAKGKFGGGKRRPWRQTQKKSAEGNVPSFACMSVVGDREGYVGIGYGKAKETVPAKKKALRNAKLNLFKVNRGCGSFDCICTEPHSIPFTIEGKSGSSRIKLMPAPKGTGLVIDDECKKVMRLAGIKDVYSKTFGQTKTKFNLIKALIVALKKLNKIV